MSPFPMLYPYINYLTLLESLLESLLEMTTSTNELPNPFSRNPTIEDSPLHSRGRLPSPKMPYLETNNLHMTTKMSFL
ncbi:unnamed protein product, partial [Vitis vinifera]|uniref:Uncharacterized protein n=1 Tax=Vitis vinifera TaxID=29760 RepID=D7TIU2_VITVI